jgi:hypothetical protein
MNKDLDKVNLYKGMRDNISGFSSYKDGWNSWNYENSLAKNTGDIGKGEAPDDINVHSEPIVSGGVELNFCKKMDEEEICTNF